MLLLIAFIVTISSIQGTEVSECTLLRTSIYKECKITDLCTKKLNTSIRLQISSVDSSTTIKKFTIKYSFDMRYLPVIQNNLFMQNIRALEVVHTGLTSIAKSDLKLYENLIDLRIKYSKLQSIKDDLFKFSKKLEMLDLSGNLINYVEPNIFKTLRNLEQFSFKNNLCFGKEAEGRENVFRLFKSVEDYCNILHKSNSEEEISIDDDDYGDHVWE